MSDVLGDKDYVTMEDLEKLQYTEQVRDVHVYVTQTMKFQNR